MRICLQKNLRKSVSPLHKALTADDLLPKGHRDDVSKSRGAR